MSVDGVFLRGSADWWREAVVYQIYPRSFKDENGDGLGDLKGITAKVDYIAALHVDAVWLSPFYPSQLADGGYDVDDYRAVDPKLGTLEDFDEMLQALHARNIRVFVDIVPNHSSDQHVWFQEALASPPGSPARERYIFRPGRGEAGEIRPSELVSHFGPTGWTQTEDGDWYLHLFAKEQPDFNWENREVHEEFLKTLRFWSDRGVDGFRIDVAHALVKQLEPLPTRLNFALDTVATDGTDALFDRDEVQEIYREWRELFDTYDPPRVAVAEAWVHPHRRPAYASSEGLGQAFNFDLLICAWDADRFRHVIDDNLELAEQTGSSSTWVMSNHDVIRHASRLMIPGYGHSGNGFDEENEWFIKNRLNPGLDREMGLQRATAATMLILALPGCTYLYQGEELGLSEVFEISNDQMQDPQWFRGEGKLKSRDGCRVPLPWSSSGKSFGFGTNGSHLPQPVWFGDLSVEAQEERENSTLALYRRAVPLRKTAWVGSGDLEWLASEPGSLAFQRGSWICQTNFTANSVPMAPGVLRLSSNSIGVGEGQLAPNTTVWLSSL